MRTRHPVLTWSRALVLGLSVLALAPGCEGKATPVDAAALGLPVVARPAGATQGEARAFLAAARGDLTITASNGEAIEAKPGTPLLADDRVRLAEGVALIIFTTGNALRIEAGLDAALSELAGFNSPPSARSLEDELAAALTPEQAQDLGLSERLGGWQLRQRAMERPADEGAAPQIAADEEKKEKAAAAPEEPERPKEEAPEEEAAGGGDGMPGASNEAPKQAKPDAKPPRGSSAYGSRALDAAGAAPSPETTPMPEPTPPMPPTKPSSVNGDDDLIEPSPGNEGSTTPTSGKTVKEDFGGWGLSHATRAGGGAVTLPGATRRTIAACVRASTKSPAQVKLTIKGGKITKATVVGESLTCAAALSGAMVEGVADGEIEATFVKVN